MTRLIRILPASEADQARQFARWEFEAKLDEQDRRYLVTDQALDHWYVFGGERPRPLGKPENPRLERN